MIHLVERKSPFSQIHHREWVVEIVDTPELGAATKREISLLAHAAIEYNSSPFEDREPLSANDWHNAISLYFKARNCFGYIDYVNVVDLKKIE